MENQDRFESNIFHDIKHSKCRKQLDQMYGLVATEQNREIARTISGKKVLDVGAGYGTLTKYLQDSGFDVVGIEPNSEKTVLAREWYGVELSVEDIYDTGFQDNEFDCVILREVVFHLDFTKALKEIDRICKKQVIIFQGNAVLARKMGQIVFKHREYNEKDIAYYMSVLKQGNFYIQDVIFRDPIAFPLSGGFVGIQLVPQMSWLYRVILNLDRTFNSFLKLIKWQQYFCTRYVINAEKKIEARKHSPLSSGRKTAFDHRDT
jgi:SAM-dependent methyltransferase